MPRNIPITITREKMDKPQAVGLGLFLSHKGERLRQGSNRIPPLVDSRFCQTRVTDAVGFLAAWVFKLPLFDDGFLVWAATAIFFVIFVLLEFSQAV